MDDPVHRRRSYPHTEKPPNSSGYDPSAVDLDEFARGRGAGLAPEVTSYHLGHGVDLNHVEPARYSTSDFNKDVDALFGNNGSHGADHQTSPLPDTREKKTSENESYHGPNPAGLKSPPLVTIHSPGPSEHVIAPRNSSHVIALPRAPPFPLPSPGDATKADAHNGQVEAAAAAGSSITTQEQSTAIKIKNPHRRRRFMRWVVKRFTGPWSGVSPHDPNHGKNAAKLADAQGLFPNSANKDR